MLFSVVYTVEASSRLDINQFSPPPLADRQDAWELEFEDLSAPRHLEGGWPDGSHRRWSAMLTQVEFNQFIRALGLRPDPSHDDGQYGAPGFIGWSAAVAFRRDAPDVRLLALATPCPDQDGEPDFVPNEFDDVYGLAMDYVDRDLRPNSTGQTQCMRS